MAPHLEKYQNSVEVSYKEINLRSFKRMLSDLLPLPCYETENMIHWIDTKSSGFISTVEFLKHF